MSKRIRRPVYGLLLLLVALSASRALAEVVPPPSEGAAYAGSGACAPCHPKQYASWEKTPHATILRDARKFPAAILGDLTDKNLPFRREDISYTVGGHRDQRYLTRIGDDYYALPRMWSVVNGTWRSYSSYGWQKRPFSRYCAGCHSVAFDPRKKTAAEFGVGCEACHGPGARHAATSAKYDIVQPTRLPEARRDEICASCHVRGKGPGDEYFFPVGWKPGKALDEYMIPIDIKEWESVSDAIRRLWETRRREFREPKVGRSYVESAFVHTKSRGWLSGDWPSGSGNRACVSCHEFGEAHARHPDRLGIKCVDCHGVSSTAGKESPDVKDIHAPGYYRVHPANLWDNDFRRRCDRCHSTRVGDWSRESLRAWPARPPTEGLAVPGTREMEGYSVDRNPVFPPIVAKPREPVAAVVPRPEPAPRRPVPVPPASPAPTNSPAPVELADPRGEAPPTLADRKEDPPKPDGIDRLIAKGKIALADAYSLNTWVHEATRKYGEVADWAIRGDRSRIFVVLDGRFEFPEGKKGDGRNVFIIPWRARTPSGDRGDSTLYFFENAACEGQGWPCDEVNRLGRMSEKERKLIPMLEKGFVRKAEDADIRQWINRWIRAGRGETEKGRTADRVGLSVFDTYVSTWGGWELPEGADANFIVQWKSSIPRNPYGIGTFYILDTGSCEGRSCPY